MSQVRNIEELEAMLRGLLKGEFSSLHLTFNDGNGPNYMSVKDWLTEGPEWAQGDWVSDDEREKGIATNSMWQLQWYPDTPIGSYTIAASSLTALVRHMANEEKGA